MFASRVLKNDHVRIGSTANGEHKNSKWHAVSMLTVYSANSQWGRNDLVGITAIGDGKSQVLYLHDAGQREVVKGLLSALLDKPITLAADEELRSLIAQCVKAIELQDEDARQVVAAIKENQEWHRKS